MIRRIVLALSAVVLLTACAHAPAAPSSGKISVSLSQG